MIVEKADRPSVKSNEVYGIQPTLIGLLGIVTLDLLFPLWITKLIGYVLPLSYVSCLPLKPTASLEIVTLVRTGLMTGLALPPMLRQQTYYLSLLLKRGMI
jgi:hypothetical protein